MYFVLDIPHEITILGGVLLLTASHMLIQLLKCMCRSPDSWCACTDLISVLFFSLGNLLFSKPRYMLQRVRTETTTSWVCPYHSYCRDGQSQSWRHDLPASSICRWLNYAKERRKGGQVIYAIFVTITSTISYQLSSRCRLFLSPFPPSNNPSTCPPPPLSTAYIVSIVTP